MSGTLGDPRSDIHRENSGTVAPNYDGPRSWFDGHHAWCNMAAPSNPAKNCRMCKGLWEHYPYESAAEMAGLMAKHFPQNVARPGTESAEYRAIVTREASHD